MALSIRTKRRIRIIGGTLAGWMLATFLTGLIIATDAEPLSVGTTLVFGSLAGLLSAWFELHPVPHLRRRLSAGWFLLIRTLYYTVMIMLIIMIVAGWIGVMRDGLGLWEIYGGEGFRAFLRSGKFVTILVLLMLASFFINFVRQVSRMLGPGTLLRLFLGQYQHPVEEERVFMFLDLNSSTRIAERLGSVAFHAFKNDFFYDVAEPVLATRGEIYQYVGDEVVVTWKVQNGKPTGNALHCFFLVVDKIDARRDYYLKRYGVVPEFKAGIHGGQIATAEVGDIKRDIVHSGDVVNTAARIEAQCRPLGRRVLVSERVLAWYEISEEVAVEDMGLVLLRGKSHEVRLFSVEHNQ